VAGLAIVAAASVAAAIGLRPGARAADVATPARGGGGVAATVVPVAPIVPDAPDAPPAASAGASVVIEVTPPDATLLVDDRAVPGGSPFAFADVPLGRTLHVRVERDGFEPFVTTLSVDGPVVRLPVALKAIVAEPATAAHHRTKRPAAPAPAATPPPATEAPKPSHKKTPADEDGTMVPPPP
jgi:hypothetical protein